MTYMPITPFLNNTEFTATINTLNKVLTAFGLTTKRLFRAYFTTSAKNTSNISMVHLIFAYLLYYDFYIRLFMPLSPCRFQYVIMNECAVLIGEIWHVERP